MACGTRRDEADMDDFVEAVRELVIFLGADVHARNKRGETPLNIAVRESAAEIAELLVFQGK